MIELPPPNGLNLKAVDYRTAATQRHVADAWVGLESFVRSYGEACARAALEAAAKECDEVAERALGSLAGGDLAEDCAHAIRAL